MPEPNFSLELFFVYENFILNIYHIKKILKLLETLNHFLKNVWTLLSNLDTKDKRLILSGIFYLFNYLFVIGGTAN